MRKNVTLRWKLLSLKILLIYDFVNIENKNTVLNSVISPEIWLLAALSKNTLSSRWEQYAHAYGICAPFYCICVKNIGNVGDLYSTDNFLPKVSNIFFIFSYNFIKSGHTVIKVFAESMKWSTFAAWCFDTRENIYRPTVRWIYCRINCVNRKLVSINFIISLSELNTIAGFVYTQLESKGFKVSLYILNLLGGPDLWIH